MNSEDLFKETHLNIYNFKHEVYLLNKKHNTFDNEQYMIKYLKENNDIEVDICRLKRKDMFYILNKYRKYIDWYKFSYIYLINRKYISFMYDPIFNDKDFIVSDSYLINSSSLPVLILMLPPERTTEIIHRLINHNDLYLLFYKIYEFLYHYYPCTEFWKKLFKYGLLLNEPITKINNNNFNLLCEEFNIYGIQNFYKYIYLLFLRIKNNHKEETFEEISKIILHSYNEFPSFITITRDISRNAINEEDVKNNDRIYKNKINSIMIKLDKIKRNIM